MDAQDATALQTPAAILAARQLHQHTLTGTVVVLAHIWSPELGNARDIQVYLPPDYDDGDQRYPVVYMHDGQNLFDQMTSFGAEWAVDETMEHLAHDGSGAIIVGIPNMGAIRNDEYSPLADPDHGGGRGDAYLTFLVETLKPLIDRQFRTRPERQTTALVGSSMGGLISLYGFFAHSSIFGFVGVLSPALWFADHAVLAMVEQAPFVGGQIVLEVGAAEGTRCVADVQTLRAMLETKGYTRNRDLWYAELPDAEHNEGTWRTRVGPLIQRFLHTR
ncbi:alpha/beta hydrolase [Herpetosiphon geysericola]|uniref:alpha/beta hydrolase n=1 Tax=Herpetosiphon geysericola TaxID=70996 RepID=UPI0038B3F530